MVRPTAKHQASVTPRLGHGDNNVKDGRVLSATFFDLPAPQLEWEKMATAPVPRLDVNSHVDIYNFTDNSWGGRFDMPREMAHSHFGMVTDGRYMYVVTGQYGPQCSGPTAHTFVLDTKTKKWHDFPPLPVSRPGLEHWSLAVKDGKALEKEWRSEILIPPGDRLYVIGGQEGDFMAKPGAPIFKCSRRNEVVFGNVYMLDDEVNWKTLPPMLKPDSHIEFAWAIVSNSIVIVGGTTEKHPVTKKMVLVGEIFQFNFDTLKWSVIRELPYRVKTTLVGYWQGWLYFISGQRDKGPTDPAQKKVIGEMWRTKLKLNS
ncbi:hypothetical protein ES319_A05G119400v1 [Gossypium barbadense]|uniref:Kelch repeat-containing protein n=1 Tax=Gossypium barbadense TaxID=3634 RepID=A0A5J5VNZ7_GOSBA|nr:hypothetical protein ES319_A05G119400v1 [Gossypium barbadense]